MSSQGETEIRAVLGNTLSNTRLLIMFGVFAVAVLIALSIQDNNLKICFWLSLVLGIVCLINLNLSLSFYIKLRNERGIQGPRGERGDKGPKGFPGRCELSISESGLIKHCKAKIINNLRKSCNNYKETINKRFDDRTVEEKQKLEIYHKWVNIITNECNTQNASNEDRYFDRIFSDSSKYCLI